MFLNSELLLILSDLPNQRLTLSFTLMQNLAFMQINIFHIFTHIYTEHIWT